MRFRTSLVRACPPLLASFVLTLGVADRASAYAGLGPMLPMIGSGIVLAFVFVVTMLGAVAYPLRMAMSKMRKGKKAAKAPAAK